MSPTADSPPAICAETLPPRTPGWEDAPVGDVQRFTVGSVRLTRVPYFDVTLPPEAVALEEDEVAALPWAIGTWCASPTEVRVGQVFWVVESDDRTIVIDPCCASDGFLRTGPEALTHQDAAFTAFRDAGFDPDRVDVVVMSHLDGIGMNALVDGGGAWRPAFGRAPIVLSDTEWDKTRGRAEQPDAAALVSLHAQGAVTPVALPHRVTPEVEMVLSGGHSPGHATVVVRSGDARALFLGHLAVSPMQAAVARDVALHDDPGLGRKALQHWLADAASDDALVIGPLWPAPGAARVRLDPTELVPAG
jgi:glyoxylase-like metal-dependent hydrolase (beta-lactamase superfamily II)